MYRIKNNRNLKSKTTIIIICLLLFIASSISAEDTWIQTYDPFPGWQNPSYRVEDVIVCSDGGYAVNGTYNGFNIQEEFKWGFVVKTDCDGNMLWAKQDTLNNYLVHTTATGMIETSDSCIISVGYSPSFGTYLIKRDLEGNRIWRRIVTDFGVTSICNTNDGNIILGGVVNSEIALRKIDEDGNTIWTNSHNCGYVTIANSVYQSTDSGFLLTGFTSGNGYDIIVMKTDANGDSLWTRTHDAIGGSDEGNCIIESSDGSILVGGHITDPGQSAGFLWLLDTIGTTIWIEHVDLETGYEHFSLLNLTDDTYVAFCNFANGAKLYNFDDNYNIIWNSEITTWAAEGDRGFKKIPDGFIGGGSYPDRDNIILFKTDETGQITDAADNEIPLAKSYELSCYPNPFNPIINFEIKTDNLNNLQIKIYNIKGQLIDIIPIENQNITWNASKYSSGIYLCKLANVETDKILSIKKVTLLK